MFHQVCVFAPILAQISGPRSNRMGFYLEFGCFLQEREDATIVVQFGMRKRRQFQFDLSLRRLAHPRETPAAIGNRWEHGATVLAHVRRRIFFQRIHSANDRKRVKTINNGIKKKRPHFDDSDRIFQKREFRIPNIVNVSRHNQSVMAFICQCPHYAIALPVLVLPRVLVRCALIDNVNNRESRESLFILRVMKWFGVSLKGKWRFNKNELIYRMREDVKSNLQKIKLIVENEGVYFQIILSTRRTRLIS